MSAPTGRERRLALNEAVFRLANEARDAVRPDRLPGERRAYYCECSRRDCMVRLELTLGEYELVRASSRRFAVAPGHDVPDVETVVETHGDRYAVVEKDSEVTDIVERTDPRD